MARIKSSGYSIEVGTKSLSSLSIFLKQQKYSSYYLLCDENTMQYCLPTLISRCLILKNAHVIEIESGEASKCIEFCNHIWQTLSENNADRKSLMINLGGGVVSDLGGFCASVYKRGIDFINVPTSLLAMADASVGGKTGIDFGGIKNLIGTFTQPKAVFVYPDFLDTLPERHFNNGMAELYKIALVSNLAFWNELKTKVDRQNMDRLISKSIGLKNTIVLKDPYDNSIRKILNFGHTVGHALESYYLNEPDFLLHGEAVLIGMIVESHLAWQKKLISKTQAHEIIETLFKKINTRFKIPTQEELTGLLKNDKKTIGKKLLFALPTSKGFAQFDIAVNESQLGKALNYYNQLV